MLQLCRVLKPATSKMFLDQEADRVSWEGVEDCACHFLPRTLVFVQLRDKVHGAAFSSHSSDWRLPLNSLDLRAFTARWSFVETHCALGCFVSTSKDRNRSHHLWLFRDAPAIGGFVLLRQQMTGDASGLFLWLRKEMRNLLRHTASSLWGYYAGLLTRPPIQFPFHFQHFGANCSVFCNQSPHSVLFSPYSSRTTKGEVVRNGDLAKLKFVVPNAWLWYTMVLGSLMQ